MAFTPARLSLLQKLAFMLPGRLRAAARMVLFPPRRHSAVPSEWLPEPPARRSEDVPLVSIIIPCWNYGRFLGDAIASVRAQTLQDHEIIIVDDGSVDPFTRDVLANIEAPDIAVLRQPNLGVSAARNAGLRIARGLYVCCLDADDTIEPTYLEKCVLLLEANAGLTFGYSWLRLTGGEQGLWKSQAFDLDRLRYYNHVSSSAVFRRDAGLAVGGFRAAMRDGYEDWEFWLRLGAYGHRGQVIPEALVNYRRHPGSALNRARTRHAALVERIRRLHPGVFGNPYVRRAIREGYRDRLTHAPFTNLARREQYRQGRPTVLLVLPARLRFDRRAVACLAAHLKPDYDLLVLGAKPWSASTGEPAQAYVLDHILPEHSHGRFVAHVARTRMVRAVLWLEPADDPLGLNEIAASPDPPFLGAITRVGVPAPGGDIARLALDPDGRLAQIGELMRALRVSARVSARVSTGVPHRTESPSDARAHETRLGGENP